MRLMFIAHNSALLPYNYDYNYVNSDVRPIFIFAISNSYVLLSLLNTLGKPEKLYCTGFGQANAEIQRFEEH